MSEKMNFYSLKNILAKHAIYNMIIGERANGKTYAALEYCLDNYFKSGEQFGLVRRWDTDFSGQKGSQLAFNMFQQNHYGKNVIKEKSNGEFLGMDYWAGAYFLTAPDSAGIVKRTRNAAGYGFALNREESYHEGEYPNLTTLVFDEFLTRGVYLTDEFVLFGNLISTIKRHRQNLKIIMLGNTINKYCPYFAEMGLYNIRKMQKGDLDVYTYGNSGLSVAVEFSDSPSKKTKVDPYYAFNNPKLKMITTGVWELDIYPHLPEKYAEKDVLFRFFIDFADDLLQGNIIRSKYGPYLYIHPKTGKVKYDTDLLFTYEESPSRYKVHNIFRSNLPIVKTITDLFKEHKVFYADNETGEIVRNFLLTSKQKISNV